MDKVEARFKIVKKKVVSVFPQLKKVKLIQTKLEDKENKKEDRHFATAYLVKKEIHYAKMLDYKTIQNISGIFYHEFGHLIAYLLKGVRINVPMEFIRNVKDLPHKNKQEEALANYLIYKFFGVRIMYDKDLVQYIQ